MKKCQNNYEFQFGIALDNCSKWHIDHFRSLSSFDSGDQRYLKKHHHYNNLQSLLAIDNIRKGNCYVDIA